MTLDLVFPALPPTINGIGDHTARLAEALSENAQVGILTAQQDWTAPPGVDIQRAFHTRHRRGVLRLVDAVQTRRPNWLLLQFEQFSYGRWGLNPFLPLALWRIRRSVPETQVAVMFHEDYKPATDLRSALMSTWQRVQFSALGRIADLALFSTEPRAETYRSKFSNTLVRHLPVGSNIPHVDADGVPVRRHLGLDSDAFLFGLFGSAHPSRLLLHVRAAVATCAQDQPDCALLYVGPDGDRVQQVLDTSVSLCDAGPLLPDKVSRCFAAMDLYLAPFRDGVSSRRGSFLTGLQHGIATVTTQGPETGSSLRSYDGQAFAAPPCDERTAFVDRTRTLALSSDKRRRLGQQGQSLYQHQFAWPILAGELLDALDAADRTRNRVFAGTQR